MKKKLFALLSVVLIVVMACSLAACKPASMFDGKYNKEATAEEAKSMWQSARTSMALILIPLSRLRPMKTLRSKVGKVSK